jgi:hypothetical protein
VRGGVEGGSRGGGERCEQCEGHGRLVERSLMTADGCAVSACGEEGLWACESALLSYSECEVTLLVLIAVRVRVRVNKHIRIIRKEIEAHCRGGSLRRVYDAHGIFSGA